MSVAAFPGPLPPGEAVLWQGAPDWRGLARGALHLRGLAVYFGLVVAFFGVSAAWHGTPAMTVVQHTALAGLIGCLPLALGAAYAWFAARACTYTITNRRVVIRMGIALPMTLNLPFARIDGADVAMRGDGTGDVVLRLTPGSKGLGWVVLWPHARGWRFGQGEPMLRALPNAERAAQVLARALAESAEGTASVGRAEAPVMLAQTTRKVDTRECNHGTTTVAA